MKVLNTTPATIEYLGPCHLTSRRRYWWVEGKRILQDTNFPADPFKPENLHTVIPNYFEEIDCPISFEAGYIIIPEQDN